MKMQVNDIINKYDNYLLSEGIKGHFDISDELVKYLYFKYEYNKFTIPHTNCSAHRLDKLISRQLNFVRLSLLRVKYFRNGSAKEIKEGFVYCVTNPAFHGYFKIGSTIDIKKRINSYQSYSPLRDFKLESYYFSHDRFKEEFSYHSSMNFDGEWCKGNVKPIIKLFQSKKVSGCIAQR